MFRHGQQYSRASQARIAAAVGMTQARVNAMDSKVSLWKILALRPVERSS
ncbi:MULTISPECIES: hypothetical protein [unclassified Streptomyces]|nr:hypothetical protein [Streptomyces sp. NBC_00162]UUU38952.1 hypothetical protein JIW86_09235 [Streptomyces sp. NBC_00162]